MRQLAISILIVLSFQASCFAQDSDSDLATKTKQVSWRLETSSSLSFTGIGTNLVVVGMYKKFETYLGPRLVISNTYGLSDAPWGLSAGLRFYPNNQNLPFQGFFNFDYQSAYYKNNCPSGDCGDDYNVTSEFALGCGFRIPFGGRLSGITSVHYALYRERYSTPVRKDFIILGYSGMLRLGLQYRFAK